MITLVAKSEAPGSLRVTADEKREAQPQWVAIQGVGLAVRTISEVPLKAGVYDCTSVELGLRDAFKVKGAFEPRGLLGLKEWTLAEQQAFYAKKASELQGLLGASAAKKAA